MSTTAAERAELYAESARLENDYSDNHEVKEHMVDVTDALRDLESELVNERAKGWAAAIRYIAELESWQEGSRKHPRPLPQDYLNA